MIIYLKFWWKGELSKGSFQTVKSNQHQVLKSRGTNNVFCNKFD